MALTTGPNDEEEEDDTSVHVLCVCVCVCLSGYMYTCAYMLLFNYMLIKTDINIRPPREYQSLYFIIL